MMVIVYIYLFLLPFVLTNQLSEDSSSNLIAVSNTDVQLATDVETTKVKQTRNRASVPQSLTLLMNFKDDGTTSFKIMQGKFTKFTVNHISRKCIKVVFSRESKRRF